MSDLILEGDAQPPDSGPNQLINIFLASPVRRERIFAQSWLRFVEKRDAWRRANPKGPQGSITQACFPPNPSVLPK
jgi:hypothetical protein